MRLVQVAVVTPVRKTFTYKSEADQEIAEGMRVLEIGRAHV